MHIITFNGEAHSIAGWARKLGVSQVTLQARIGRYAMPLEVALQPRSLSLHGTGKSYKVKGGVREHITVAERALGKPLPKGSVVHHIDENPRNNDPSNLVICPDHAYHAMLHQRMKSFAGCGHYDWRKCSFCHQWDALTELKITASNRGAHHPACHAKYHREMRHKREGRS